MQTNPYPEQVLLKELLRHYKVLLKPQVRRYLSNHQLSDQAIKQMWAYMARHRLLYLDERYIALNKPDLAQVNTKNLQAFWVLLTIKQLLYHHPGDFPVQIHFLTETTEGEIIYAALGEERLLNALLAKEAAISRIIIVEEPEQIPALDIANVQYYCTVSENGQLAKYVKT